MNVVALPWSRLNLDGTENTYKVRDILGYVQRYQSNRT